MIRQGTVEVDKVLTLSFSCACMQTILYYHNIINNNNYYADISEHCTIILQLISKVASDWSNWLKLVT